MTFNVWTFLFEIINFIVLAYILHLLLYRPLRQAIDERRRANERERADAVKAHQEALALQKKVEDQLAEMDRTRQASLQEARQQALVERQRILTEAEQQTQRQQEEFRQNLTREREEMLQKLRAELVALAVTVSERLLREACDRTLHQQLLHHLAERLEQVPANERAALRDQWQPEDGVALESASVVDPDALAELTRSVTALLGQAVPISVRVRSELLGGARLRIGGHIWDGSLAGQLQDIQAPSGVAVTHG